MSVNVIDSSLRPSRDVMLTFLTTDTKPEDDVLDGALGLELDAATGETKNLYIFDSANVNPVLGGHWWVVLA